jgi:hypothetical protein
MERPVVKATPVDHGGLLQRMDPKERGAADGTGRFDDESL